MRIHDALEIPAITDLDQFITRLDNRDPERQRQDMAQFVMAPAVQTRVNALLEAVGQRFAQGLDMGRYIYGTFGSGKSHLMAVLGKMFEQNEELYRLGDPALGELRQAQPWIDEGRYLVVRLNMMGKRSLVQGLYEAYLDALPKGEAKPSFTDQEQIFQLIEGDAERMGGMDELLDQLIADRAIPTRRFYERGRRGDLKKQLSLAARLASWRDHGTRSFRAQDFWVDPEEGFHRISQDAEERGYRAVVWLVDELIIWIRGKARQEYVEQINALSALVDHDAKLSRPIPFFVAVAVQHDIRETCPDDLSEQGFHQQLGFISDRFSPPLDLEDQDLFEVAARRVLRPRAERREAYNAAVDRAFKKQEKALKLLSGELEPGLMRRLYPFHPALLRVLVDLTQALSRSRTAMAALYSLLRRYRELKVGQFIPLGSLYEILFTKSQIDGVQNRRRSPIAERFALAYDAYERLKGQIDEAARSESRPRPDELHQLVKSVLLCQLSERPYFPDGASLASRVKASTLLRLNQSDIRMMNERLGLSRISKLFRLLASNDAQVQLSGDERDPQIAIRTERLNIEPVVASAQAQLSHADRFAYCRRLIDGELGLKLERLNERSLSLNWRGSKRKIHLRFVNVRRLSYGGQLNEFAPKKAEGLILVDYPFDEELGRDRQDDIATIQAARKRKRQWSLAWLPAHFSEIEKGALEKAAAIERIRRDSRSYLSHDYSPAQAQRLLVALEAFQGNQEQILKEGIRRLYFEEGEIHSCSDLLEQIDLRGKERQDAIEALGREILDARWPRHPNFKRLVRKRELSALAGWVTQAAATGRSVKLKSGEMEIARNLGLPLQMVYLGNDSISRRMDGEVLQAVHAWIGDRQSFRAGDLRVALAQGGREGFGFNEDLFQFFAFYLLQVEGYEAQRDQVGLTVESLGGLRDGDLLSKADVLDHPSWEEARRLGAQLLGLKGRADLPSAPEQNKLCRDLLREIPKLKKPLFNLKLKLEKILIWAGDPPSPLKEAISGLIALLKSLSAPALPPADRLRRLITASKEPGYSSSLQLLSGAGLEGTERLFKELGKRRLSFKMIQRQGSPLEQTESSEGLRALLSASLDQSLTAQARSWLKAVDEIAERLIDEPPKPPKPPEPPEPPEPPISKPPTPKPLISKPPISKPRRPGPPQLLIRRRISRAELEVTLREMLREALQESDAQGFDLQLRLIPREIR